MIIVRLLSYSFVPRLGWVSSTMHRASVVVKPEGMVVQSLNPEVTWCVFTRPTHER